MFKTAKYPDLPGLIESLSTSDPDKLTDVDMQKIRFFVHSDGCTKVPNLYKDECYKHDFYYRTHVDFSGRIMRRKEADRLFRIGIQKKSGCGVFNLLSWWRWAAVRLLAYKAWYKRSSCHG